MNFKTTVILFMVFIVLLGVVFLTQYIEEGKKDTENKLVALSSENVEKIVFKTGEQSLTFKKNQDGEWLITEPIEAKADNYEVNQLAEDFSDLTIERVVEEQAGDRKKYQIPQKEVILYFKDKEQPVKVLVGMKNSLDNTFFAQRAGDTRIVLLPSSLSSILKNSLFDFRKKDIFSFSTDKVGGIKVQAKDIQWQAAKKEDEWFLQKPVQSLAVKSTLNSILNSLSNLEAKEFVSEQKTQEQIKNYNLDTPSHKVELSFPAEGKKIEFFLQKKEDKLYATTSLSSKIIQTDDSILSDLEKKVEELREKEVAKFYSWDAHKLTVKTGEQKFTVEKDEEGNWFFQSPFQKPADKNKVETFLRKVESLEAEKFIDPPFNLQDYGLDSPEVEINISVKQDEEKTEQVTILVGKEDKEKKKVVVKNSRLDYLFQVSSEFLKELPQSPQDWVKNQKE